MDNDAPNSVSGWFGERPVEGATVFVKPDDDEDDQEAAADIA